MGLQAQVPNSPYLGLWTRVEGFRTDELVRLITERRVLRAVVMRGTLHLVTARDYLMIRPLVQPLLERILKNGFGRHLAGTSPARIAAAGEALLSDEPRTGAEVAAILKKRWPDRDARALGYAVQYLVPLVQVPPRGVWGETARPAWLTAAAWLGRPSRPTMKPKPDVLVERYLGAFGPASVADMRAWSGLPGLREVVERLRPRLRVFRGENGQELFDRPESPRPDPDSPAPPRFLPCYDNALLAHADRTRILPEGHGVWGFQTEGLLVGTVLLDGFVRARWRIEGERGRAVLDVQPCARLSGGDRAALAEEGDRLLAFACTDASRRDVRVRAPR